MPDIPQELIDCIIDELHDIESLKSCTLTARSFRDPSQRKLLRSLTLQYSPNYSAVYSLLKKSPHIAKYVKRLTIRMHHDTSGAHGHWKKHEKVLGKLGGVRWCKIFGQYSGTAWNSLTPGVRSAFIDFILHQPLRELHVYFISGIPLVVFLNAPPLIVLEDVDPGEQDALSLTKPHTSVFTSNGGISTIHLRPAKDLVLHEGTEEICAWILRPEFVSFIAALRRLSVDPEHDSARNLIHAAAQTLEHLHLCSYLDSIQNYPVLPPLPALRFFEAVLGLPEEPITPILNSISAMLSSDTSPNLIEIDLTFWNCVNWDYLPPCVPDARVLAALDTALTDHPAVPTLRWRMYDVQGDPAAFVTIIRDGMPRARDKGQLVIEEFREEDGFADQWPPRSRS
ncbi:hypothetical protein B0H11DRAFT_2045989 [Mycena galericulata]|nr:hypothetical protein B0H11DRAFT_2045989 [Mycena galericulata]